MRPVRCVSCRCVVRTVAVAASVAVLLLAPFFFTDHLHALSTLHVSHVQRPSGLIPSLEGRSGDRESHERLSELEAPADALIATSTAASKQTFKWGERRCSSGWMATHGGRWMNDTTFQTSTDCVLPSLSETARTLMSLARNANAANSRRVRLAFLGDSQSARYYGEVLKELRVICDGRLERAKERVDTGRCNKTLYFGLQPSSVYGLPADEWIAHIRRVPGRGPASFGLMNRGCSDCNLCSGELWSTERRDPSAPVFELEFIPVEFALDIEQVASVFGESTQDTVAYYFCHNVTGACVQRRAQPRPDHEFEGKQEKSLLFVVWNTGLHDRVVPSYTKELYTKNVLDAIHKFYASGASSVSFIHTTATCDARHPERYREKIKGRDNLNIFQMNVALHHALAIERATDDSLRRLRVPQVDAFALSAGPYLYQHHDDGVHVTTSVARLIASAALIDVVNALAKSQRI